jgi:hypothetical protein
MHYSGDNGGVAASDVATSDVSELSAASRRPKELFLDRGGDGAQLDTQWMTAARFSVKASAVTDEIDGKSTGKFSFYVPKKGHDVEAAEAENYSATNDKSDTSTKEERRFGPEVPSFEGYTFTLLGSVQPGAGASWTRTKKAQRRAESRELFEKAVSYERKTGWSCIEQYWALSSEQQTLVRRLLAEKNTNEENPHVEWTLFGVRKLYEVHWKGFKTAKFNDAIRITLKKEHKVISTKDTENEHAKNVLSENMLNSLALKVRERKRLDSKRRRNFAAEKSEPHPGDVNMEFSASYNWKTASVSEARVEERDTLPEARTPLPHRYQEASPSGESMSIQTECTPEGRTSIHNDVHIPDLPVASTTSKPVTDAYLFETSERIANTAKFVISIKDLEPFLTAACQDVDVGVERLEKKIRRLIRRFGSELRYEVTDMVQLDTVRTMVTPTVSLYLAQCILRHVQDKKFDPDSAQPLRIDSRKVGGVNTDDEMYLKIGETWEPVTMTFQIPEDEVCQMNLNRRKKESQLRRSQLAPQRAEVVVQSGWTPSKLTVALFVWINPLSVFLGRATNIICNGQPNVWSDIVSMILGAGFAYLGYRKLSYKSSSALREHSSSAIEERKDEQIPTTKDVYIHDLLYDSEALNNFKAEVLEFVHESYEKRILTAIGGEMEQSGFRLEEDVTYSIAREISWVPVHFLTFSDDYSLSYTDKIKASIEEHMGESWNWWPLAPRLHQLRPGYCRLQWISVCGSSSPILW